MSKWKSAFIISILIIFTGFAAFAIQQKMMSIQVKKSAIRSSPSFLGKIVDQLKYGDRVAVRNTKGSWYFINRLSADQYFILAMDCLCIKVE